jgi:AcrR family transcriptional regulator
MEPTATRVPKPGLRERKKQRTRQTILTAALELFSERGYANTTLEDIAEAAEVSTGTLFAYFPSKDEILFPEERSFYEQLRDRLERRPPDATTFTVLRHLVATREPPDETFKLRLEIFREQALRDRLRARQMRVEDLLADAIAKDLDAPSDDLRPTLLAAATSAALGALGERHEAGSGAVTFDDALSILERMFTAVSKEPRTSGSHRKRRSPSHQNPHAAKR